MKWADYLISKVHYTTVNTKRYISKCKVHEDNGDTVGGESEWTREEIIKAIDRNKKFKTIFWNNNTNEWNMGEDVSKMEIGNYYYLRTDPNDKEADNLENLPEY